jgi:hypothetical protein
MNTNYTDGIQVQLLPESIADEDCGLPRYLQLCKDEHGALEYANNVKVEQCL